MARNNNNKLKAFVRFDGSGRIIPSSLIVQAFKPAVGNWQEIDAKECCNYVPTTTTSTTAYPAENCIEFVVDTTDGTEFTFSFNTTGPINFTIDWGDGTTHIDSGAGGFYEETHSYPENEEQYTARICFDSPESVLQLDFYGND
jgi:hypothetical protein